MFSEPNDEFSCATCELVFDSVNDVKVHEWHEHHGSSSTKCEACITGFTTRGEMMNHVRIHYLYCCNFCSLNTNSWTFYKEHVSEHCKATPYVLTWETGENVHECSTCVDGFDNIDDLEAHLVKDNSQKFKESYLECMIDMSGKQASKNLLPQSKEKRHVCPVCEKGFSDVWSMYLHMTIHTREKPDLCPVSKKGFSQAWDMKETGENVHECSPCVDSFDNIDDLEAHFVNDNSQKFKESYLESMIDMNGKQASRDHFMLPDMMKPTGENNEKGFSQACGMKETGENVHECSPCVDSFDNIDDLEAHFVNDNSQKFKESYLESMIDMNGKQASTDHFMLPDMMKPTGENNEKGFSQACGMKETGENVHECSPCVDSFDNIDDLEAHFVNDNSQKFKESYLESMIDMNGKQASTDHFMLPDMMKPTVENNETKGNPYRIIGEAFISQTALQSDHVPSVEKRHLCPVCNKCFSKACDMKRHMIIHNGEKPYLCPFCQKGFHRSCDKKRHMRIHTGEKPHLCPVCQKGFSQAGGLKGHMRIHTGERPYLCPVCKKSFSLARNMKQHMTIHTGEKPYLCPVCKKGFNQANNMKEHLRIIHTGEKPYLCPVCKKGFSLARNMKLHTSIHTGEKPHHCPVCKKGFSQFSDMKRHVGIHTGEEVHVGHVCPVCKKVFSRARGMKEHMRIHTGEKPHLCPVCKKGFRLVRNMRNHMGIHTEEKPHLCPVCKKGFSRAVDIKRHMTIHTGEKPHPCPVCKKGFSQAGGMKEHMKTHTREKSHLCHVCEKGFSRASDFKRHMRIHTAEKPHLCPVCEKGFSQAGGMKKHMRIHNRENPHLTGEFKETLKSEETILSLDENI